MKTLNNVLKFIDLKGMSIREFEGEVGLTNGTLKGNSNRKVELSADNINKIVEKFSKEFIQAGYYICDLLPFGIDSKVILNQEEISELQQNIKVEGKKSPDIIIEYKDYFEFIEIKTASGKKLHIIPEGKNDLALLNAFLEERDRVINTIKEEKQARIDELSKDKDDLLKLLNSDLGDMSKVQQAIFAMVMTLQKHEAVMTSQGNKKREVEMLETLSRLNADNLKVDARQDNALVLRK